MISDVCALKVICSSALVEWADSGTSRRSGLSRKVNWSQKACTCIIEVGLLFTKSGVDLVLGLSPLGGSDFSFPLLYEAFSRFHVDTSKMAIFKYLPWLYVMVPGNPTQGHWGPSHYKPGIFKCLGLLSSSHRLSVSDNGNRRHLFFDKSSKRWDTYSGKLEKILEFLAVKEAQFFPQQEFVKTTTKVKGEWMLDFRTSGGHKHWDSK